MGIILQGMWPDINCSNLNCVNEFRRKHTYRCGSCRHEKIWVCAMCAKPLPYERAIFCPECIKIRRSLQMRERYDKL